MVQLLLLLLKIIISHNNNIVVGDAQDWHGCQALHFADYDNDDAV